MHCIDSKNAGCEEGVDPSSIVVLTFYFGLCVGDEKKGHGDEKKDIRFG